MKTINRIWLNSCLILGFFLIYLNGSSQDVKLNRQERKELKKAQMQANFRVLDSLLNSRNFVLEADFLRNRYGQKVSVPSSINFIRVNESTGVFQTGSSVGLGYNNVGGVTAEGRIGKWEIKKNHKSLSYTLSFSLLTQIGHFDIVMFVNSDNLALATIRGLWPGELTWEGHLNTIYNSRIFKGQNSV